MVKKILFVCKYNRFRSRVAKAYLEKINSNVQVESAGLIKGMPVNKLQTSIAKKFGLDIQGKPKGLSTKILLWADVVIVVADDVPKKIFNNKKYENKVVVWKIKDSKTDNLREVERIIKEIIVNVTKLNKKLKNGNSKRI